VEGVGGGKWKEMRVVILVVLEVTIGGNKQEQNA
jgi:hypothetical protein